MTLLLTGRTPDAGLISLPELKGLRFVGGLTIKPEFSALLIAIAVFGVMLLAVAAYLLERIVPPDLALLVWAVPVVVFAVVLGAFERSAAAAREIGCDALEIHGAHGYLLAQFLSPLRNHRDDDEKLDERECPAATSRMRTSRTGIFSSFAKYQISGTEKAWRWIWGNDFFRSASNDS